MCLDSMFASLSGASRYSAYAVVSREGRLSTYTPGEENRDILLF
jgi:hypothetical protein